MEYRTLGKTGIQVSTLGFGASPLGEEFGPIDAAEGERAVHAAIDQGVTLFDTAPFYGRTLSETRLGQALAGRRDQVVISTKACRYGPDDFDFSAARVTQSIDESLARLQTDYVDILYIHDVEFGDREQILAETLPAAQKLKEAGKTRAIGVSALQLEILADIAERFPVDIVLSYARYNLAFSDLDILLRPALEQREIGLVNASPLLLGALTNGEPPAWHPADAALLSAARDAAALCRRQGIDIAALALRHCLDHPYAASTLVGMSARSQLEQNLQAYAVAANPALLHQIQTLLGPHAKVWKTGRPENHDRSAV